MRILFVTSYPLEYDSSSNVRNLSLINGMIKDGHNVSTFSPYPTNLRYYSGSLLNIPFEKRYWFGNQEVSSEGEGISSKPSRIKRFLIKLYSRFSIYDRRSWLKKQIGVSDINDSFDVMVSSSDPKSAHLFAERLLDLRPSICKKWIQYWGDPMSNDITAHRLIPSCFVRKEESRILGKANKIVYVSPLTAHVAKKTHPSYSNKIYFYPVPFRIDNDKKEFSPNNKMVSYIGDYYSSIRNMRPLIAALNELKIPSAIIGNSDIKIPPTDYFIIKNRIIGEELKEINKQTGVYVCVCNKRGTQIPGKIYHNVNTGKPILVILDGEYLDQLKDYLKSFNRYYVCMNDKDEIIESLKEIYNNYKLFDIPRQLLPEVIAHDFLKV